MSSTYPRGLYRKLSASAGLPVIILEGARTAGKTTLAREWAAERGGSFVDLTRGDDRQSAELNGESFVDQLQLPCVIDEAQLVKSLTLDIKRRVDRAGNEGQILLTGSSRMRSEALGGSDPLAGRAERLRLFGLTRGEQRGEPVSIINWIRAGNFTPETLAPSEDILEQLFLGQLPNFPRTVTTASRQRTLVGEYVTEVLRDSTLGTQFDRTRILDLLRIVASAPATILNIEKLAKDLGSSRDTISRHLSLLENCFLINRIPALASDARRELMAHPRMVPADTAFTPWALGLDRGALQSRSDISGGLLHSWVANELLAQASWGDSGAQLSHWRRGDDEADLVLRFDDGTLIPIEVKLSTSVTVRAASGITTFLKSNPGKSPFGIVFYTGDRVRELTDSVWAIPLSSLWHKEFDMSDEADDAPRNNLVDTEVSRPTTAETALFLSYVHEDDAVEGGRITQLGRDVAARYGLITGEPIEIFIDKDSLRWGDEWQKRIRSQLLNTTFFMPVITPSFLKSTACRDEFTTFESTSRVMGTEAFIVPVLWSELRKGDEGDPIANGLKSRQWVDWTKLKFEDPASGPYRRAVNDMAERLADAVELLAESVPVAPAELEGAEESDPGDLLELMENAEAAIQKLPDAAAAWQPALIDAFSAMGDLMTAIPAAGTSPSMVRAAIARSAQGLGQPIGLLEQETQAMKAVIDEIDATVHELVALGIRQPELAVALNLSQLRSELPETFGLDQEQLRSFVAQLETFGAISRELRTPARVMAEAVTFVSDMESMLHNWRRELGSI